MIALAVFAAIVLSEAAAADGPAARDDVARLVRGLDARELAERERAERELVRLGPAILPQLPEISPKTPAEVAERLARIQQQLLVQQARSAAEPTQVTLKGSDLPLAEALSAISLKTGNPIVDHRAAFGESKTDARVNVELEKAHFWRAMDEVLDQAGLTLYPFTGQRGAFVVNRPADALPRSRHASYSGPFRVAPVRFEAVRDLRSGREQSLKFFLEVGWEPRLQPIALTQPLARVNALGDDGKPIEVSNVEAQGESMIREVISAAELEIPLRLPPRHVARISSLKGQISALVPGPRHDFRFPSLESSSATSRSRRVEQRRAGATVTVDSLRPNNDVWEVSLRVKFDAPANALESHRGWILDNQACFESPDGKSIAPGGFEQTRQAADEVGVKYYFDLPSGPAQLVFVYRTPVTILQMNVDYEFHDLELP